MDNAEAIKIVIDQIEELSAPETDFQDDLSIDIYSLEMECVQHPILTMKWGKMHALAIQQRDIVKLKLETVSAELDADIRINFQEYGFSKKPPEDGIKNWVKNHEKYIKVSEELVEANQNVNTLGSAIKSIDSKNKMLGIISNLYVAGYFGVPKVHDDTKTELEMKKRRQEQNKQISKTSSAKKVLKKKNNE